MTPQQLLEQLEKMGIEANLLRKIRSQVDEHNKNSHKPVKIQAILKYLVQKGALDQSQADALAKVAPSEMGSAARPAAEDDIADLIAGFDPPPVAKTETKPTAPSPKTVEQKPETKAEPKAIRTKEKSEKKEKQPPVETPKSPKKAVAHAETVYDPRLLEELSQPPTGPAREDAFSALEAADMGNPNASRLPTFLGKKDKRNQWATKWLYIASTIVGLLVIFGAVLALATTGMSAEQKFQAANESFERLAYSDAAKKFEDYYTSHPNHKNVPTAKALRVQSLILSYEQNKNYDEAIRIADRMLPEIIDDPQSKIDLLRDDLAVVLPRALVQITEEAKKVSQIEELRKQLERSEGLKMVIDNVAYIPTSQRNKPMTAGYLTRIDNNIKAIKTQIDKEEQYQQALIDISSLGEALKTTEAFAIYRRLTRNFGDLAAREELRKAIENVSLKERELVKPLDKSFTLSSVPRASSVVKTHVLSRHNGATVDGLKDEIFCFLADGSIYAVRGSDGGIIWRRFVGFQTETQPAVIGQDRVLISDQQEFDLMVVNQTSGELIWRLEIGEPFLAPAINDVMIVVTTRSGTILRIDPNTGEVTRAVKLPQSTNVSALITDREPLIYQVGGHSNLYVLSKEDLSCREVFYLGHELGSIAVPPVYWSGYLALALNRGMSCDLWLFRPDAAGLELQLTQVYNVFQNGIVTYPIQRYGSWISLSNTQGEFQILELLTSEEAQSAPVTRFAGELFENSGANTFMLTEGNNIWIAGLELSRIKLQRAQSKLTRETIANAGDLFITPMQRIDDYLFHVRRRKGSGMISASLVDSIKLEPVWRIDFGGVVPGAPVAAQDGYSVVSNQGDLFHVDSSSSNTVAPVAIGSRTVESLKFEQLIPFGQSELAAIGVSGQREMIYGNGNEGLLLGLASPANNVACRPLVVRDDLIVPSSEGPIVRINPRTGQMVGTPFMPPIAAGKKTVWLEPALLENDEFAIANGASEGSESKLYLVSAANSNSLTETNSFKAAFPFKSRLVKIGDQIFIAIDAPNADQMLAIQAEGLAITNQVDLPGRLVAGPWVVGDGILVRMDDDQLVKLDSSLAQSWKLSIPNERLIGSPELIENQIVVGFQSGELLLLDPANGVVNSRISLRQPISSMPTRIGANWFCSGLDGTVHQVELSTRSGVN